MSKLHAKHECLTQMCEKGLPHLSNFHRGCLFQVAPWSVHYINVVRLVPSDGVGLDKLYTVIQGFWGNVAHSLSLRKAQVHMR